jgi:hypothetical protein
MRSERGLTMLEVIVIIFIVVIAAGLLLPLLPHRHTESRRTSCASNLNQLAKAMFMYSDVPSNGTFPCAGSDKEIADPMLSLGLLYNKYVADPKVFSCPSNPIPASALAAITPGGRVTSSYGYDPAHGPNDAVAAIASDWKGAGENSDNHGPNAGQNVMIGAGTIEFMESASRRLPDIEVGKKRFDNIFQRDSELERQDDGFIRQK